MVTLRTEVPFAFGFMYKTGGSVVRQSTDTLRMVCLESPPVPGALQLWLVAKAYGPSLSNGDPG